MSVIDKQVSDNLKQYVHQCLLASGVIVAIIEAFDVNQQTVIIATLGATSFIVLP